MNAAMEKDDDVLTIATERFERRLSEEMGKLRHDMTDMRSELKGEILGLRSELKGEMSGLREDMTRGLANVRVEIIKWSFAFWVAQLVTFATLFLRSR